MGNIDHILVDLDGVLADFVGHAATVHKLPRARVLRNWPLNEYRISKVLGMPNSKFWKRLEEMGSAFWRTIPPTDELVPMLDWLQTLSVPWSVCTSPSLDPYCLAGKLQWMEKWLRSGFRDYVITPQKYLLASPTTLLIDDSAENVRAFRQHGGRAFCFPRPWTDVRALQGVDEPVCVTDARSNPLAYVREMTEALIK